MLNIDPSHFVALSFFILLGFLVWKRFFNVGAVLDAEINLIKEKINNAAHARETAYVRLKNVGIEFEDIDEKIAAMTEKGRVACDTLVASMKEEIADEIKQKKMLHQVHAQHLEERFRKIYQEQLITEIFAKLMVHIKENANDAFYEQQLVQSLGLLNSIKIAA